LVRSPRALGRGFARSVGARLRAERAGRSSGWEWPSGTRRGRPALQAEGHVRTVEGHSHSSLHVCSGQRRAPKSPLGIPKASRLAFNPVTYSYVPVFFRRQSATIGVSWPWLVLVAQWVSSVSEASKGQSPHLLFRKASQGLQSPETLSSPCSKRAALLNSSINGEEAVRMPLCAMLTSARSCLSPASAPGPTPPPNLVGDGVGPVAQAADKQLLANVNTALNGSRTASSPLTMRSRNYSRPWASPWAPRPGVSLRDLPHEPLEPLAQVCGRSERAVRQDGNYHLVSEDGAPP
jgi:hypothetical protein